MFFTNSGSESVETGLKIAIAYQRAIGQGTRTRLIGRERGYHGVNFGGISVGGISGNRKQFGTLLAGVVLASATLPAQRTVLRHGGHRHHHEGAADSAPSARRPSRGP